MAGAVRPWEGMKQMMGLRGTLQKDGGTHTHTQPGTGRHRGRTRCNKGVALASPLPV